MSKSYSISRGVTLALLSISAIGCASGGGGNGGGPSFVRMDMGISTAQDFQKQTVDLFRRQAYQVFRAETDPPTPMIQSEWRNHTPTEDELELGVTETQLRIIVRGRERPPQGNTRVFNFTCTMETQVKTTTSAEWIEMGVTSQRRAFANEFGTELRTLLELARR